MVVVEVQILVLLDLLVLLTPVVEVEVAELLVLVVMQEVLALLLSGIKSPKTLHKPSIDPLGDPWRVL